MAGMKPPSLLFGLSGKVLALTIVFVMIGEVLIFLPSIANFRVQWMKARVAQAEIAALAAEAAPDQILKDDLRMEILKGAGVLAVSLTKGDKRQLVLREPGMTMVEETYDLRPGMYYLTLMDAIAALLRTHDRVISVVDVPPNMSGEVIQIAMQEQPLSNAMRRYGLNILGISIVLSLIVAALIFAALNRFLVRPMKRLSANMTSFGDKPEDPARIISPSTRRDELGAAEHELHDMQTQLQQLLQQKNRLASLGLAVSKVSHDLRNMLTSAQLLSDRLVEVKDPHVQRFAPKLITSLDRAISFLNQTLTYGKAQEPAPQREKLKLRAIVADVLEAFSYESEMRVALNNDVDHRIMVEADREQLGRILTNLVRNAMQAFQAVDNQRTSPQVTISATRIGALTEITVTDNGPGVPEALRHKLFEAFQSAAKPGGTGLGLAICAELARAHCGTLRMATTGATGTSFVLAVPDQNTLVSAGAAK
jgi:signal transduction histidine kinase